VINTIFLGGGMLLLVLEEPAEVSPLLARTCNSFGLSFGKYFHAIKVVRMENRKAITNIPGPIIMPIRGGGPTHPCHILMIVIL
jgi:hypothetical protein